MQGRGHHVGLLHVPRLLLELFALGFVHFAALEDLERFLLDGRFPGAVAHLGHASLIGGQFGRLFGDFDVKGFDVRVDL